MIQLFCAYDFFGLRALTPGGRKLADELNGSGDHSITLHYAKCIKEFTLNSSAFLAKNLAGKADEDELLK